MNPVAGAPPTVQPLASLSLSLSNPALLAETLLSAALDGCADRLALPDEAAVLTRLLNYDESARHHCLRELAQGVAHVLSLLDSDITRVYSYDPAELTDLGAPEEPHLTLPLHLVICTRRPTAALISLLAALDRALQQDLADRVRPHRVAPMLHVHVIDDANVRRQTSCATLLFTPHQEPIQVWRR